jgi:8-oxo-dGTP pyrophosphatase MutT (NUDIX family)
MPFIKRKLSVATEHMWQASVLEVVQAGGIIVWRDRIVLRRTALGEWVFPKGWIDPGETAEQAAIREVREETGVRAEVARLAGRAAYEADGETRNVVYYLMRVTDSPDWSEHAGIDAASVPYNEVADMLTFDNNRHLWLQVYNEVHRMIRTRRGWALTGG